MRSLLVIALSVTLWGCSATGIPADSIKWKIYSNSRYRFEFPYPSNWTSLPPPENDDGIAFVSAQKNSVEIRGWAGNRLPKPMIKNKISIPDRDSYTKTPTITGKIPPSVMLRVFDTDENRYNFQTAQGVSGVLTVFVGNQQTEMTLRLTQGQVNYYWQGRCESQEFDHYYRFFYYIAQQYRISGSRE